MAEPFTWIDGERTIRFGRGTAAGAGKLLGTGYALLTTPRALRTLPGLEAGAGSVHEVAPGHVEELSAALLDEVPQDATLVVALGGGRVVDTAKAVAAGRGGRVRAAAIPTTLSSAEMTRVHRLPKGAGPDVRGVRPAIVVNDPALSASQPADELAASAANSLAHAAEAAVTVTASPVPRLAAAEAARLTAEAYAGPGDADPGRDELALAALLSGYALDSTRYGLHHVCAQTMVRVGGVAHGASNAALLPHTLAALARRAPDRMLPGVEDLARLLASRAGAERLRDLGVPREALAKAAHVAAGREADLDRTPPRADEEELLAVFEAAW